MKYSIFLSICFILFISSFVSASYVALGELTPDATGVYIGIGEHNGKPQYSNDEYIAQYDMIGVWILSITGDVGPDAYWRYVSENDTLPLGIWEPVGDAIGDLNMVEIEDPIPQIGTFSTNVCDIIQLFPLILIAGIIVFAILSYINITAGELQTTMITGLITAMLLLILLVFYSSLYSIMCVV